VVTCEPANANWTLGVSGTAFTVEGHTLTCVASTFGSKVTLSITSGGIKKSFGITAVSKTYDQLRTYLTKITNNYTSELANATGAAGIAFHTANYEGYETAKSTGGIIKADNGNYYGFTINTDSSITVTPGRYSGLSDLYIGTSLSSTVAITDFSDTAAGVTLTDADKIQSVSLGASELDISSVANTLVAGFTTDGDLVLEGFKDTTDTGYFLGYSDVDTTTFKACEDYIAAKTVPAAYDISALTSFVEGALTSRIMKVEANILWVDDNGAALTGTELSSAVSAAGVSNDTITQYTNADNVYNLDAKDGGIYSYVTHTDATTTSNSGIYYVKGVKANDAYTYTATKTTVTTVNNAMSINNFSTALLTAANWVDISTDSATDGTTSTIYQYTGFTDKGALATAALKAIPLYGASIYKWISQYSSVTYSWYDFFTCYFDLTTTGLTSTMVLNWDTNEKLSFTITYSGVGTDAVPTDYLANVTFGA
jgi:hypothetical protein